MKLDLRQTSEKPLHTQIALQIRRQIESGAMQPGDRLPSYNEVRAQHGVHTNTMEKVLAYLHREGLIERQRGLGTFVAERGCWKKRAAREAASTTIGLAGPGFAVTQSGYWGRLLEGMRLAADDAQAQLLILNHASSSGWEKADGVLICGWRRDILRYVPPELPCVSVLAPAPRTASVSADDYTGGRLLTEHLLALGHRRIAYLHGAKDSVTQQRHAGYRDALKAAGITPRAAWTKSMTGDYDYGAQIVQAGHANMAEWLRENWRGLGCTAILAHNDETAVGVMAALREEGLEVPRDVSVVGFDGAEIGSYITPRLTTIELPLRRIGERAVEMLLAQIQADAVGDAHEVLPVQLIARDSSAAPQ